MSEKTTMFGAVYRRENDLGIAEIKEIPIPAVKHADDVLIKVEAVSICGTDIRSLANPPAFFFKDDIVIGHEFAGIVTEIGQDVTNCKLGDKVVVHPNIWCGKCPSCRSGHTNQCDNFQHIGDRIDGALAEYICVPEKMVYTISHDVPSHLACLTEPLGCVLNATTTIKAHPGEDVVILGGGPIGLIFAMIYKASGTRVFVSEPSEYRRQLAMDIGVDGVINPITHDLNVELRKIAPLGADIVVDAVGVLLPDAMKVAKKGGRIAVFGINQSAQVSLNEFPITEKELEIHGAYITKGTFPLAIKLIESGILPLEKIVTHRLPFKDFMQGVELMRSGLGSKVVVEI